MCACHSCGSDQPFAPAQSSRGTADAAAADSTAEVLQSSDARTLTADGPITRQPVTLLALVCRFLGIYDLLAMLRCSRLMSAATLHPLTFHLDAEFTVDPWNGGADLHGLCLAFWDAGRMRRTLTAPILRRFRLMTLVSHIRCTPLAHAKE